MIDFTSIWTLLAAAAQSASREFDQFRLAVQVRHGNSPNRLSQKARRKRARWVK